jgi:hypothetical protein
VQLAKQSWWNVKTYSFPPGQMPHTSVKFFCASASLYVYNTLIYTLQHSGSSWGLLEGTWLCQTIMEEQTRLKGWRCRHCCFVWVGMLCMVLCWWDCRKGIYFHRLLCLNIATSSKCRFLQSSIGVMPFYTLEYGHSVTLILFLLWENMFE